MMAIEAQQFDILSSFRSELLIASSLSYERKIRSWN